MGQGPAHGKGLTASKRGGSGGVAAAGATPSSAHRDEGEVSGGGLAAAYGEGTPALSALEFGDGLGAAHVAASLGVAPG